MELAQAGIFFFAVSAVCKERSALKLGLHGSLASCVTSPGQRLGFPEDHWSDEDAVLEDSH